MTVNITGNTGGPGGRLPRRNGPRPKTRREGGAPHAQLSQTAPAVLQEELLERARALPGVFVGASLVSVPGARALFLEASAAGGPPEAFQAGREFAHLHPPEDGSTHLSLPPVLAKEVVEKGWGEPHPAVDTAMVYGPRDEAELEIIWRLFLASHRFATGQPEAGEA